MLKRFGHEVDFDRNWGDWWWLTLIWLHQQLIEAKAYFEAHLSGFINLWIANPSFIQPTVIQFSENPVGSSFSRATDAISTPFFPDDSNLMNCWFSSCTEARQNFIASMFTSDICSALCLRFSFSHGWILCVCLCFYSFQEYQYLTWTTKITLTLVGFYVD